MQASYPMRFFLSDLNNNNMYKSTLSIIGINPLRKLFLREILLFRNFIPEWYSDKIKYINLRDLNASINILNEGLKIYMNNELQSI